MGEHTFNSLGYIYFDLKAYFSLLYHCFRKKPIWLLSFMHKTVCYPNVTLKPLVEILYMLHTNPWLKVFMTLDIQTLSFCEQN
jgi:hypothetical protein